MEKEWHEWGGDCIECAGVGGKSCEGHVALRAGQLLGFAQKPGGERIKLDSSE
jgi:hypothetical protein